MTDKKGA